MSDLQKYVTTPNDLHHDYNLFFLFHAPITNKIIVFVGYQLFWV